MQDLERLAEANYVSREQRDGHYVAKKGNGKNCKTEVQSIREGCILVNPFYYLPLMTMTLNFGRRRVSSYSKLNEA